MIIIQEVKTKKELKQFILYPNQLYKNCPYFVPSLYNDEHKTLTEHPAKSFCNIRLWLAYKDGKIVGRIAGIINHRYNELKDKKRIRFGWFDVDDDIEVAKKLFETVENWGRQENLLEISGPSRYSNMEKQGMMVDGFDVLTTISCEYNYPYYPIFMDTLGYEKEEDYIQMKFELSGIPEKIKVLNEQLSERYGVKVKEFKNKKDLIDSAEQFFKALNNSFVNVYNFIPLTDEEIQFHIKNNFSFADKDLIKILVDKDDEIVGFSLSIPSLSEAFRKSGGRLLPFGWYHILRAMKKNNTVNLWLTGVLPKWMNSGVHVLYHYELYKTYLEKGYKYAITNQQLERNHNYRIWERYGGVPITRRRCYCKGLKI
ncbi:MAG: hypothetical protein LBI15_10015 [Dysgonamonadaceae bacterium]|jgi:hypothetical protein|nr:hypothetical protein [Dysgonamonadaceae bacterium]